MKHLLLSTLACAVLAARLSAAAPGPLEFFVAPDGNDTWTGTQPEPTAARADGPFATLPRAVAAVRAARQAAGGQVSGRPIIEVRGGTYYLAHALELLPEDSGLILRAYRNERPVLSGGVAITNWQADAGCVSCERFLCKDVHAFVDGVLEVKRAKGRVRGQQHHVVRPQAVDCLLIGIEADKLPFWRHIDLIRKTLCQVV